MMPKSRSTILLLVALGLALPGCGGLSLPAGLIEEATATPAVARDAARPLQAFQTALEQIYLQGSPADMAGLRGSEEQISTEDKQIYVGGDVIIAIDEQPIRDFGGVLSYLAYSTRGGQVVTLTVIRKARQITIDLVVAGRPTITPPGTP